MGLDLIAYPVERHGDESWATSTRLGFQRQAALFEKILEIPPHALAITCNRFEYWGPKEVHQFQKDGYGAPLRYLYPEHFQELDFDEPYPWNEAVLAFLRALAPGTPIILYWY